VIIQPPDISEIEGFQFTIPNVSTASTTTTTSTRSTTAEPLMTDVFKTMTPEDAFAILSDADFASDGEVLRPEKAKAGEVYFFKINDKETLKKNLKMVSHLSLLKFI
jgi:hypothetical protein